MNKITQIITAVIFITGSFIKGAGSSASDIGNGVAKEGERGNLAKALAYALPGKLGLAQWCANTFSENLETFQLGKTKQIDTDRIHKLINNANNDQFKELKAKCEELIFELISEAHEKSVGSKAFGLVTLKKPINTYEDRSFTILKVCRAFLVSHNLPGSPLYDELKLAVEEMMDAYTKRFEEESDLFNPSLWPILKKWEKQKSGVSQATLRSVSAAGLTHLPQAIQDKLIPYLHNTRLEFAEYIINTHIYRIDNLEYEPLKKIVAKLWENVSSNKS